MSLGSRIKQLREDRELSQVELAKILGVTDKAVSTWENDLKVPRMGTLELLAKYFGVTKSYIIEGTEFKQNAGIPIITTVKVPLLGNIACGSPVLAVENIEDYIDMDKSVHADFALRCKGDSMINARILDGDIVYIRKQDNIENGEIAAVLIDECTSISEATLKRVYIYADKIRLCAENPQYTDKVFFENDMNKVRILGKAVAFLSSVN